MYACRSLSVIKGIVKFEVREYQTKDTSVFVRVHCPYPKDTIVT